MGQFSGVGTHARTVWPTMINSAG